MLLASGCADQEEAPKGTSDTTAPTKTTKKTRPKSRAGKTKTAPMVQERSTFKTEVTTFGIYDSKLQKLPLPKGYEDDLPGPRLLVIGRILNASKEPIHRGGVFGHLEVCAVKENCVERPSHGRGFTVPLSGTEPWRAGTWRHFTVLTRAVDPVYRELTPSQVKGRLELKAEGPVSVDWEGEIWNSPVPWAGFGGYPVMKDASLSRALKHGPFNLSAGTPIRVLAVAGMKAFMKSGTRSGWVPLDEVPLGKELLAHVASPTKLPARSQGEGLKVTVHAARSLVTKPSGKEAVQERYLIADVEVETTMESKGRIASNAFKLISGSDDTSSPERKSTVTNRLLSLGRVERGTRRRGDVVFKIPFGVNPLVLTIAADKMSYVEVVLGL